MNYLSQILMVDESVNRCYDDEKRTSQSSVQSKGRIQLVKERGKMKVLGLEMMMGCMLEIMMGCMLEKLMGKWLGNRLERKWLGSMLDSKWWDMESERNSDTVTVKGLDKEKETKSD